MPEHHRVDEQPVLVDQPVGERSRTSVMLAVVTMSLPGWDFSAWISSLSRPRSAVVCSHSGSCRLLETTYFDTMFR